MDVVNQNFDDRLAVLKLCLSRTDGLAEFALDNGIYSFSLPALSEQPIQASGSHQIGSGFSIGVYQFAVSSDWRNNVKCTQVFGVKSLRQPTSTKCVVWFHCECQNERSHASRRSNALCHCSDHSQTAKPECIGFLFQPHRRL